MKTDSILQEVLEKIEPPFSEITIMQEALDDFKTRFKESGAKYLVHGHSHMKKFGGKRINMSVDLTNFCPVQEENLLLYK